MDKSIPKPNLISFLLLPIMYFISVKLCLAFAITPEGTVIIWLPNVFSLAALLYYRGQQYWLFMLLVIAAEIAGDISIFRPNETLMLGLSNVAEVTMAYFLMRKFNMSLSFYKLEDIVKFIVAGPIISSLFGAFIGAAVIQFTGHGVSTYLSTVEAWWFGDALGLIIGTPLLLTILHHVRQEIKPFKLIDILVATISIGLLCLLILAKNGLFLGVVVTPTLLIPSMLYLSSRTNLRCTAIAVAIFSFVIAMSISAGKNPFGEISKSLTILQAQEFILILSIACLGFSILLSRIRDNERELEKRVAKRTNELNLLNQTLKQLSATDGLTGIANRRHFDEVLEFEWARAKLTQQVVTLAFLDIDWFKSYNDHYGHQAGDECLRKVTGVLYNKFCRTGDLVARYGGEEFVLIAPGMDSQHALKISKKICKEIKALAIPHERSKFGFVTVCIGVTSMTPRSDQYANVLIKMADEALYEAKGQGRNNSVIKCPLQT